MNDQHVMLKHRYMILFVTLLFATSASQFNSSGGAGLWFWHGVSTLTIMAMVMTIARTRWQYVLASVLGMFWLMDQWGVPEVLFGPLTHLGRALGQVFLFYAVTKLFRFVLVGRDVSGDRVYAAVAGYVVLVWLFAGAYALVYRYDPGAFGASWREDMTEAELASYATYFSTVTQTTLGYGDVVPLNPAARALAMLQALMGVLYLAVTIARLVGNGFGADRTPTNSH